ncbi:MAG: hypothetical protein ABIP79_10590, partial [Chitinophagaceae bacterium]
MQYQFISLLDYLLLPVVLAIVYALAFRIRDKKYPKKHPWHKYYIPALTVKIFGAIFIGLIYAYYYKGGDTFNYFYHSRIINSAFNESSVKWVNLLLHIPDATDGAYYEYIRQMEWYSDPASYTVASMGAFVSFFTLNTYLPAAVIFAFISFTGVWALFRTFALNFPQYTRAIAVATLFIPSTFIWGSAIFKDTVCLFGLGWLTYSTFRFLIQKDFTLKNIVVATLSFMLIAKVKLYILLGFIPALLVWILFLYSKKIQNKGTRMLVKLFFIGVAVAAFMFFIQLFGKELGKYSLDKIAETAEVNRGWISYMSTVDDGSSYDLGDFDPSIGGMLVKFPAAVNATLFRPYLWESRKIIVFLSSLEALLFLFLTLKILFTIGLAKTWKTISGDPTIQFCLLFSIIFAFAVGISTYNFGALSRYKIPCLPFY